MQKIDTELNMKVLNNFIGYGNPSAEYWFMGIEEHLFDSKDDNICEEEIKRLNICKKELFNNEMGPFSLSNDDFMEFKEKDESNSKNSPTYRGICKIFKILTGLELDPKLIGDKKINVFICNLFPLARPRTFSDYNNFIKLNIFKGDFNKWKDEYGEYRRKAISKFFQEHFLKENKQKYLICLGTSFIDDFQVTLNSIFKSNLNIEKHKKLIVSQKLIYCIYHPSSRKKYYNDNYLNKIFK